MSTFSRGDRVRIVWPLDEDLHGRTGTVMEKVDVTSADDDIFTVRLDEPLHDGTEFAHVWADCLHLLGEAEERGTGSIEEDDILTIVAADDGAAVVAIHDCATRCIDVRCSTHGLYCTYILAPDTTVTETRRLRGVAAKLADQYATDHRMPRADRAGGSS